MNKRQSKIDSIKRLIDPSSGATDGERQAAKAALERVLKSQFGDAEGQRRLDGFYTHFQADTSQFYEAMGRAFSGADFVRKKRAGMDVSGEWTGMTIEDALFQMVRDYMQRMIVSAFLSGQSTQQVTALTGNLEIAFRGIEQATEAKEWDKHSKKENMKGH